MKRFGILTIGVVMTALLAACGQEDDVPTEAALPEPIEVELTVPETAEVMEPVTLTTLVTQGEEKVEDATEVEYEIWQEGKKEDSIHIDTSNDKGGLYSATTTFENDGVYHVQVHVTAREMHVMPEKKIQIGEVVVGDDAEGHESHEATDGHHDHGSTEGLSIHFVQPEEAKADTGTELMTHVQLEGKALENTKVRYEITDPVNGIQWVETEETKPGEYTGNHSFAEVGTYKVTIHIENDTIHEHEEHTVEVK
ncbi:FixH family protein [Sporosarcina sp. GW1-11]|uniref:FixH family protein n=1 Tax=Sporosarcina sp. GW1-11 TaxID=2899126 RepID=UPI00294C9CD8|nr:FixH family protein [Sporosarcina sp. GW1-11]MDV6377977.1 FixH family protein [Sporosarcina sp. GW1-11]